MNEAAKQMLPERTSRIRAFARFFKSYMSVSTIVAASIPIPVASLKLIPVYSQQRGFLTVYSSLFCFLLLAFVFSIRHRLAPLMFSDRFGSKVLGALPLVFIFATMACILAYHSILLQSTMELRSLGITASTTDLLNKMDSTQIPDGLELSACYLGIFLFAEAAFVLMAIREYLQDALHLDESALLRGVPVLSEPIEARQVSASRRGRRSRKEVNQGAKLQRAGTAVPSD